MSSFLRAAVLVTALVVLAPGCRSAGVPVPKPSVPAALTDSSVELASLPRTTDEFLALRDQVAGSPRGGAAMFVAAMIIYTQDEQLGRECLTIAVDQGQLSDGGQGYKGKQLSNRSLQSLKTNLGGKPYVARSYVDGATPDNGYALPPGALTIRFQREDETDGQAKVFVYSSGADTPRPITLRVNDKGVWKAWEWSSLEVGVRKPVVAQDDPF